MTTSIASAEEIAAHVEALRRLVADEAEQTRREVAELRADIRDLRASQPPRLLAIAEVAKLIGVCERTVRRRVRDRELAVTRVGRRVLVDANDLRPKDIDALAQAAQGPRLRSVGVK